MTERYGKDRFKQMMEVIRSAGKPYGIAFSDLYRIPNSHMALEASEFAKEHGKFHEFHEALFYANFVELKDIGNIEVLLEIAQQCDLSPHHLKEVLDNGQYNSRLLEYSSHARKLRISATPTFIINDTEIISGAQPLEVFRRILSKYKNG